MPESGTILVIEDDEMTMGASRAMLERLGYQVLAAKTGRKAIDIVRTYEGEIDLVLLDINLPDMKGDRIYPLIKEVRPNMKVMVCSGYSIEGSVQAILDAGALDFIQKPFTLGKLSEKLKTPYEIESHI